MNRRNGAPVTTRRIAFLGARGTEMLDLVGPLQVFARASEMYIEENPGSPPAYSVEVVTTSQRRSLVANCGLRITANKTFRELDGKIDTLLIAGGNSIERDEISTEVARWLRKIARRIRRVGSVCTGAMLLARAGLLDGRRATTHWNWCEVLIRRAPRAHVDPNPIFIRDENVYTSAGVTAGMDLALALVEEDHGSRGDQGEQDDQRGHHGSSTRLRRCDRRPHVQARREDSDDRPPHRDVEPND